MKDPRRYHQESAGNAENALRQQKKRLRWAVLGRLLSFLLLLLAVWTTWDMHSAVPILSGLFFLLLFLFLVRLHARLDAEKERLEALLELHREDLERLDGNYPDPPDPEGLEPEHPFAIDMDLFAKGGVIAWIDRSFSRVGRKELVQRLLNPMEDPERIRALQEAVAELADRKDERMDRRAQGRKLANLEVEDFEGGEAPPARLLPGFLRILVPVLMSGLFLATLIGLLPFQAFLFALVIPFGLLAFRGGRVREAFQRTESSRKAVKGVRELLVGIEEGELRSEFLRKEQGRLWSEDGRAASEAIADLDRILEGYEARSNPFVGILLNALLLWDLQCHERLRRWINTYGEQMPEWIEVIGRFDALGSLASVPSDHPDLIFPEPRQEGKVLEAEGMGHPLIDSGERVDNDLEIPSTGHIKIITGANMAGKSTFLRTVGVNWILAKAGTAVCAKRMEFRPLPLFSSMRTNDSLQDKESFFYAELKRLRLIVDELEQGKELLILLDEILQGTNSEDKKRGSRRFLERILQHPVAGLIATHDLDLTAIEEERPEAIENLCFEAELQDGSSYFDHLLRKGVCRNMNASALMERMGIG